MLHYELIQVFTSQKYYGLGIKVSEQDFNKISQEIIFTKEHSSIENIYEELISKVKEKDYTDINKAIKFLDDTFIEMEEAYFSGAGIEI